MAKLKARDPNVSAEDPLSLKPFTGETSPISLNFTDEAPSRWFQSFGFDGVRADRAEVRGAAWDKADSGLKSILNLSELDRAEELTKYSDEELRSLYRKRHSSAKGGGSTGDRRRPTLEEFGISKEVRQPIYECDAEQIVKGDTMVVAGKQYIDLIKERNCILLDTEMVLGHPELGYTGQPDKVWLIIGVNGDIGILITDWKTNKPKNF